MFGSRANLLDMSRRLPPIDPRNRDVHEDQIGLSLRRQPDRLLAIQRLDHRVSEMLEYPAIDDPIVAVVLDQQNCPAHRDTVA